MEIELATRALAALGQSNRLAVFRRLVEAGPQGLTPSEIAQALDLPGATLSFHLKALATAGLIHGASSGRSIRYRADFDAMHALIAFLTRDCCGGNPEACAPLGDATSCGPRSRTDSIRDLDT